MPLNVGHAARDEPPLRRRLPQPDRAQPLPARASRCGSGIGAGYVPIRQRAARRARSSYTFRRRLRLAFEAIISFSDLPLRFFVALGAIIALIGFLLVAVPDDRRSCSSSTSSAGYTSTIAAIVLLGGVLISVIGVASLYIGRILSEVQGRPLYVVRDSYNIDERTTLTASTATDDRGPPIERDGYAIVEGVLDARLTARAPRTSSSEAIEQGGRVPRRDRLQRLRHGPAVLALRRRVPGAASTTSACIGRSSRCSAPAASSTPTRARRCRPGKTNYSRRIHVDCPRLIPGYVTNMGATILLDDFTEDNGADLRSCPRSHTRAEPAVARRSSSATRSASSRPAGSVFFFNARLWHAGGDNRDRRAGATRSRSTCAGRS